jgi:TonB family protein
MRRTLIVALIAALAWPTVPANARGVTRLQPATPWVVDYAENSCRLGRTFGEGKKSVTLVMNQFSPGDWFQVMLTGHPLRVNGYRVEKGKLRFGPNEAESKVLAKVGETNGGVPALVLEGSRTIAPRTDAEQEESKAEFASGRPVETKPIGPAREAAATWIELKAVASSDLILETGPMDRPLAALRECSWDMIRSWGLNVEQQKKLTRKPRAVGGIGNWFNVSDYPMSMLQDGYEGLVTVRLLIDAEGKLTSCKMQASTQPKEFNDVVCAVIQKRGTFEPALDEHGRPVPSYWTQTVNFRLSG